MTGAAHPEGAVTRRTGILRRPCPHCGQVSLRRVGGAQRGEGLAPPLEAAARVTHMRCGAAGCGFEGWVPRRARRRGVAWWTRRRWRRFVVRLRRLRAAAGALLLAGFATLVGAAAGAAWERGHAPTPTMLRADLPPGEYHDGDPLPAAHPLAQPAAAAASAPLDLRASCVWGRPGRDPYRGSVAEALRAARLPEPVRARLEARIAARDRDGRLAIGRDAIRDVLGGRSFAPVGFAMTYGRTLCLETRVNFPVGHEEPADLYEVHDDRGRRYSVMVPEVCGNVSFIAATARDGGPAREMAADTLPAQLKLATMVGPRDDDPARSLPEPGTLACLIAAAAGWALLRWQRLRAGAAQALRSRSR